MQKFPVWLFFVLSSCATLLASCGDDSETETVPSIDCTVDELYDQVNDRCVPRGLDTNNDNRPDLGMPDMSTEPDMSGGVDMTIDMGDEIPPGCDEDGDGALAESCGGNDCDDQSVQRSPNNVEFCDEIDNNCSGEVNDGIDCSFFAHSGTNLYRIDPFKNALSMVSTDLPNLQDIDTHPDGTLYGVTFDGLYIYLEQQDRWVQVGEFGIEVSDPNGMAIDNDGTIFVTSQDKVYTVDLATGAATLLGDMNEEYYSSGDCVVDKGDTLFMTSKHDQTEDHLIRIDRMTGEGSEIGPIGTRKIFALTSAWGTLYGLTDQGEVLTINPSTGEGSLKHQFQGVRFFGAASTPLR